MSIGAWSKRGSCVLIILSFQSMTTIIPARPWRIAEEARKQNLAGISIETSRPLFHTYLDQATMSMSKVLSMVHHVRRLSI